MLAYQAMNHFDNQLGFNDGYHVTHHLNSQVHWTDLPYEFLKNIDKYAEHDVMVFDGLSIFMAGFYSFLRRYDLIYNHHVSLGKEKMTYEEFLPWIKDRLKPV